MVPFFIFCCVGALRYLFSVCLLGSLQIYCFAVGSIVSFGFPFWDARVRVRFRFSRFEVLIVSSVCLYCDAL